VNPLPRKRRIKLAGGLVRGPAESAIGRLRDFHLNGGFFSFPAERMADLERARKGVEIQSGPMAEWIGWFFRAHGISAPGVPPEALAERFCSATELRFRVRREVRSTHRVGGGG
jgi:hypothetical protein